MQEYTALSTTEAQYKDGSEARKEAIWLHRLSTDFLATSQIDYPAPTIYFDSQSTINLIRILVYHAKMKQIIRISGYDVKTRWNGQVGNVQHVHMYVRKCI